MTVMSSPAWIAHLEANYIEGIDSAFDYILDQIEKPYLTLEAYGRRFAQDWREGRIHSWPAFNDLFAPQDRPQRQRTVYFLRAALDECAVRYGDLTPAKRPKGKGGRKAKASWAVLYDEYKKLKRPPASTVKWIEGKLGTFQTSPRTIARYAKKFRTRDMP